MQTPANIDWTRADRNDVSDAALRDAIAGTLINAKHAGSVLAERLANRCVARIVEALGKKYPRHHEADLREVVEDAAADVVMQVQARKLKAFDRSPTGYVYKTALHELQRGARNQKGHEVTFSDLEPVARPRQLRPETTAVFVNPGIISRERPDQAAIRREMLRLLGAQVGRLPRRQRQVIARIREGLGNRAIAEELKVTEATVRSTYEDAKEQLQKWLDEDGQIDARYLNSYPAELVRGDRRASIELLEGFAWNLSSDCGAVFKTVHAAGGRMAEAIRELKDSRAATEAVLVYAYWAIFRRTGLEFPRDFAQHGLKPHPHYDLHVVQINFW